MFHSNIRGYNSKKTSLNNIINVLRPNAITLNEVGLRGKKKCSINGYNTYTRNRQQQSMGGIATSIRSDESQFCLKVDEGEINDEYLITRHCQFLKLINLINCYGEQEGRSTNSEIEERFMKIWNHLKIIEVRNEEAIFIGDLNKLVGNGPYGVKGNNPKVTFGGKLIQNLLKTEKYLLVNNSDRCVGGPFTRIDPSNPNIKSCLSLVIISKGLEDYVDELKIDSNRNFTPHRATKTKLVYTDHYSLIFKLKQIPIKVKSFKNTHTPVIWNTHKDGGWEKYHDLTINDPKLEAIMEEANDLESDELMAKMSKRMDKIKFQSFGKVKRKISSINNDKELSKLYEEKIKRNSDENDELDEKINQKILEYQLKDYERKLYCLKQIEKDKGKSASVFKLKEKIVGSKKVSQEAVSMKDPDSGDIILETEKLKEASIKYVSNLLTNRSPKDDYREEFDIMVSLHDLRMDEENEDGNTITDEDFATFLKQITKKNKEKYQFILKAGKSYKKVLLALYRKVWDSETKPSMWKKTTCIQLYKGKGKQDDFNNQRFIHTKDEIPKGFEQILINKVKPSLISNCSKFQIGAMPGHQAAEHLFNIKSMMALYKVAGKCLIIQCYDLRKYFDSENLKDAMNSLFHSGVKGKEYKLIYELNKENQIQIQTSVGMTEPFETGPSVSQGSIGGGLISTINLDYSINRFFLESCNEIFYHDIKMLPLIYQDDLGKFSSSRLDAQAGNDRIEACMETKLLDLHQGKSCYILVGNKEETKCIKSELDICPLTLYGMKMKEKPYEKYLGDFIHSGGVSKSVETTVNERHGKTILAIKEIRAIVEDCRSNSIGGLKVGLDIWESAYIPSLLNNSSTWMEIDDQTLNKLEEMQNTLYRSLLSVPHTTPKASLTWEVGGMMMKFRIMMSKLILVNHIMNLEDSSLAKQILNTQIAQDLPGLKCEAEKIIGDLGLPNCLTSKIQQKGWKLLVKKAISRANEAELREKMESYKKVNKEVLQNEKFGPKDYLSNLPLSKARTLFKHKYGMTEKVKMNFKGNATYARELWKCNHCKNQDSESHLLWCSKYEDMRKDFNLKNDSDLCSYLQKVFKSRSEEKSK